MTTERLCAFHGGAQTSRKDLDKQTRKKENTIATYRAEGKKDTLKKNRIPKGNIVTIDAMTIWESQKPKYNGFACGYGAHGKRGYNRNAEKRRPLDW